MSQDKRRSVFSKNLIKAVIFLTMTGLLFCGPVVGSGPERWPLQKGFYGTGEDHIKGDVFRVVVNFTNRSDQPLQNVTGKLFYPKGVIPYPEKIYQKKISKFPWPGHFVDEDKRIVIFHYDYDIRKASGEFYCYFEAQKYGTFDFDYAIEWLGSDSLFYRATPQTQEIILLDSLGLSFHDTSIDLDEDVSAPGVIHRSANSRWGVFWVGMLFTLIIGAVIGIFLSRKRVAGKYDTDKLIKHFEEENEKMRTKLSKRREELEMGE